MSSSKCRYGDCCRLVLEWRREEGVKEYLGVKLWEFGDLEHGGFKGEEGILRMTSNYPWILGDYLTKEYFHFNVT